MEIKISDIILYNGELGKVISGETKDDLLFHPMNFGTYYYNQHDLQIQKIELEKVKEPSLNDKIKFIENDCKWLGTIVQTHCIGEFQFVEYICNIGSDIGKHHFSACINFEETSRSYRSLESAMIGTIAYKYDGANSQAGGYFEKMIGLSEKN